MLNGGPESATGLKISNMVPVVLLLVVRHLDIDESGSQCRLADVFIGHDD